MVFPLLIDTNGEFCGHNCPFIESKYSRYKCNLFNDSLTEDELCGMARIRSSKCKTYTESLELAPASDKNRFTFKG